MVRSVHKSFLYFVSFFIVILFAFHFLGLSSFLLHGAICCKNLSHKRMHKIRFNIFYDCWVSLILFLLFDFRSILYHRYWIDWQNKLNYHKKKKKQTIERYIEKMGFLLRRICVVFIHGIGIEFEHHIHNMAPYSNKTYKESGNKMKITKTK